MASAEIVEVNVLILGAGPAGSTLSLFLSKENIPHVLIDKATFPRDKICGDALSGKVIDVLKKLDERLVEEIYEDKDLFTGSYGVKFAAPSGKFIDIPFKKNLEALENAPGFISKRIHFDQFLFQHVDRSTATVIENAEVKELRYVPGGVECLIDYGTKTMRVLAKIVVGAEGDRSLVARKLSQARKDNRHYCAGLRAYYKGVTGFHEKNFIELHFLKELLPGYLWIFPLAGGEANVGVGMLSSEVSRNKVNLRKVMLDAIQNNATIKHRFSGATLAGEISGWGLPLGSKKRRISGDHFILTGDAASLIDPFTGEGIGNAMFSAMLASRSIKSALAAKCFDGNFFRSYDKAIYDALWNELKLSRTLQKLSKYSSLFNYVVGKAERNATLRETITCMFDDLSIRNRLRRPGFYFKLLFD